MSRSWWARSSRRFSSCAPANAATPAQRREEDRLHLEIFRPRSSRRRFAGTRVHEADPNAPIGVAQDLGRHVARDELVALRKNHAVAANTEGAGKDDLFALAKVALRILIGLLDQEADLPAIAGNGARQVDPNVIGVELGVGKARAPRLLAGDLLEAQVFSRHPVGHPFVARDAPLSDRVEEDGRSR